MRQGSLIVRARHNGFMRLSCVWRCILWASIRGTNLIIILLHHQASMARSPVRSHCALATLATVSDWVDFNLSPLVLELIKCSFTFSHFTNLHLITSGMGHDCCLIISVCFEDRVRWVCHPTEVVVLRMSIVSSQVLHKRWFVSGWPARWGLLGGPLLALLSRRSLALFLSQIFERLDGFQLGPVKLWLNRSLELRQYKLHAERVELSDNLSQVFLQVQSVQSIWIAPDKPFPISESLGFVSALLELTVHQKVSQCLHSLSHSHSLHLMMQGTDLILVNWFLLLELP